MVIKKPEAETGICSHDVSLNMVEIYRILEIYLGEGGIC
jgi:hypothetical protein